MLLPGMSGVVANVRVGDPVFPWAADHLEPGVSAGNDDRGRHQALQFLACLGNSVRVVSGPAAGAEGTVVGKHAFVLVDFPQSALPLQRTAEGRLRVDVALEIPAHLMGAGLGMSSEWANCDVMFTHRDTVERLGAEGLRLGDVVVMHDQDHRFGRGYRKGMCAIGIVAHGGYGSIPGHGTGVVTIMSGPSDQFEPMRVERANVRDYLDLPE
jgi:hypothetical protein